MAGIFLPVPPKAVGAYAPVVIRRGIGFVSGQFPLRDGRLVHRGRIGAELTMEEGQDACRIAALNVLAQIASATNDFADLDGLLRLDGYVASADSFLDQPKVLDAASQLFIEALGRDQGEHARTAFAMTRLPLDAPTELTVTFALRECSCGADAKVLSSEIN